MSDRIPSDFDKCFLDWFRRRTEEAWARYQPRDFMAGRVGGLDWQGGIRWSTGPSDAEINQVESWWAVRFPPDYRLFLRHLHTMDRAMVGARFVDATQMIPTKGPSFYTWLTDTSALREAFEWPLEGLLFDLRHNDLWLPGWGARAATLSEGEARIRELVAAAPRLIPIYGHRYILGEPHTSGNPVLSVYQSDIIVYGQNLRSYLLVEFAAILGISPAQNLDEEQTGTSAVEDVPFWGEFLAWNNEG